ncbi:MAG: SRPBCC family protein [Maricaulaceae bacterium]
MGRWVARIGFGIIGLLLLAVIAGYAFLPTRVEVTRETTIARPPATVFTLVNSLRTFDEWSLFTERDPDMTLSYEGPEFGPVQASTWDGPINGKGRQTLIDATPYERVDFTLFFEGQGEARYSIRLTPVDDGTQVAWSFFTETTWPNLLERAFFPFIPGFVSADYDKGLGYLKNLAESLPEADFADLNAEFAEAEPRAFVYTSITVEGDEAAHAQAYETALRTVADALTDQVAEIGEEAVLTTRWAPPIWAFDAGFIVKSGRAIDLPSGVALKETPAGPVVRAYADANRGDLRTVYAKLDAFVAAHRRVVTAGPLEIDAPSLDGSGFVTLIEMPVAPVEGRGP